MTIAAIIPARSGSKRLPGKNIRPLAGKPLIVWSIEAALEAGISEVVVTTDDEEIGEIAAKTGAKFVRRPADLATDTAATLPTVRHAASGLEADTIILLQPTSPLRTVSDVRACLELHHMNSRPVVSVNQASPWLFWRNQDGTIIKANLPDGAEAVYPNGAVYVCSATDLNGEKAWWNDPVTYVMPPERSVDIDTLADFKLAEALISQFG